MASGLPVAALDRDRLSELSEAARCSFAGIGLRADVRLHGPEPGQVRVQLARLVAQLAGEVAQLLGEPRPRILGVGAPRLELLGDLVQAIGLAGRGRFDLALLGDDRVLRVRQDEDRDEQQGRHDQRDGRSTRQPWLEQRAIGRPDRAEGVRPLTTDEPVRLGCVAAGVGRGIRIRRAGGRGEGRREFHGARDAVAQARLAIHGQCRLTQARARPDDGDEEGQRPDDRQGHADGRRPRQRHEPRDRPQHEFRDRDHRDRQPRPSDDAPDPQPLPMRRQRAEDGRQRRIERSVHDGPWVGRDDDRARQSAAGRGGASDGTGSASGGLRAGGRPASTAQMPAPGR